MSHFVTIVRQNPERDIALDEWLSVLGGIPELVPERQPNSAGSAHHADGPRNVRIWWHNGCIITSDASLDLVYVAFKCAQQLDAEVLGPKGGVYASPDDWEKRTRLSRAKHANNVERNREINRKRIIRVLLIIAAGLLIGYLAYNIRHWK